MEEQEKFMQLQMLNSHYRETAQQVQVVEQELAELNDFAVSLEHLSKSDEKKMLAPLGRGIYVPAERIVGESLFVEVGAGIVVRKKIPSALEIIKSQISQLSALLSQLRTQETFYEAQLRQLVEG
jgi:prefoldin alpha subunit